MTINIGDHVRVRMDCDCDETLRGLTGVVKDTDAHPGYPFRVVVDLGCGLTERFFRDGELEDING